MAPGESDGRRWPTLETVAAHAGVSRATVSRVVNGRETVDPRLRTRVEASLRELGYVPNQPARALASRRGDTAAIVVCEPDSRVFHDPFIGDVAGDVPLTTVHQPSVEMGRELARLLVTRQGNRAGESDAIIFPTRLVVRESA